MSVTVRYFAGAAEASGVEREVLAAASVGELVAAVVEAHGTGMRAVMRQCSLLVGGRYLRDESAPLEDGSTVDVLPPFAGG